MGFLGDSGGILGSGFGKEQSKKVTKGVTRGYVGVATGGLSEIKFGKDKKGVGERVADVAGKVDQKVLGFFRGMDPTKKAENADPSGVNTAQAAVAKQGVNSRALAAAIQKNPTAFQTVKAPGIQAAQQVGMPAQVQAQQVQAGTANAMMIDPAQIAAMERAQAANIMRGDEQAIRASQIGLAEALQAQAAGTAPSLAEQQLARQNELAVRQQLALAGSQRGMTPAMAQRQAAMNIANLQGEQGARAAELRIQEQQAARAQLADVLNQTRGVDVNLATQQAQLQQQAGLQNAQQFNAQNVQQAQLAQQAALANQGEFGTTSRFNLGQELAAQTTNAGNALDAGKFNVSAEQNAQQFNAKAADEMARFQADAGLRASIANQAADLSAKGMDQAQIARLLGIEQASLSAVLQSETGKFTAQQAQMNQESKDSKNLFGNVLSTGASVLSMMSDERQKKNISSADSELKEFVDNLAPHTYEYKDTSLEGTAPGKRYGIMAQALERSAAGKSIVRETAEGKKIDVAQGLGVALAALAAMNKRLGKVEGRRA